MIKENFEFYVGDEDLSYSTLAELIDELSNHVMLKYPLEGSRYAQIGHDETMFAMYEPVLTESDSQSSLDRPLNREDTHGTSAALHKGKTDRLKRHGKEK